jgi:sulfite reductase (ferredoxin)
VRPQAQKGYSMVTVFLSLGDISAWQLRGLAQVCRRYVQDTVRTTVDQNLLIRWISNADLPALHQNLLALDLGQPGALGMANVTACPGTDSCKLGIASSRGLAAVLHEQFANGMTEYADRPDLKIKISGCFNACGQHHIADIGFFGNAASFGLSMGKVSAKNVPVVVQRLTDIYTRERQEGENFAAFTQRVGKSRIKQAIDEFDRLPDYSEKPEFYRDSRQPWDYFMSTGVGECAGEVVTQAEFRLSPPRYNSKRGRMRRLSRSPRRQRSKP